LFSIYQNLCPVSGDLLVAAIDTSLVTFEWAILFIANYPEVQKRLRQEIDDMIGDRTPTQDDLNYCHYTYAVISETQRFRTVGPLALPHKTLSDITIGIKIIYTIFINNSN